MTVVIDGDEDDECCEYRICTALLNSFDIPKQNVKQDKIHVVK